MSHIQLSCERQVLFCKFGVGQFFRRQVFEFLLYVSEYLGNGVGTFRTFTEHVFGTRLGVKVDACHSGSFLSTVMLLLHHKVELVQPIHPCSVLLLVVFQWLEKSHHRNSAFMFQWFHLYVIFKSSHKTVYRRFPCFCGCRRAVNNGGFHYSY